MAKEKPLDAGPLNPHVPDHLGDKHWGQGGRFIIDPATGQRVPAPDETEVHSTTAPASATTETTESTGKKGK